jgi:anthranilate phosphoribosyltransferase
MSLKFCIEKCLEKVDLTAEEAAAALELIMTNQATDVQIAGFLVALRAKGESVEELVGFARTMREKSVKVSVDDPDAIDMCGTGGDGTGTFNISTVAAFVAAGAGVTVAKHGNRSVSSRSGSADVLMALGVNVQAGPRQVEESINRVGIGFLFAPLFHPAMKYAAKSRTELGIRTIFNMVGPITNPASVQRQLIGTYNPSVASNLAGALRALDSGRACVVHSSDGMDEVTTTGETHVNEVERLKPVRSYSVNPSHFGLVGGTVDDLRGGSAEENAVIARRILDGEKTPARDVVIANAAFGIYVGGKAKTLKEAGNQAIDSIDAGRAREKLEKLVEYSQRP